VILGCPFNIVYVGSPVHQKLTTIACFKDFKCSEGAVYIFRIDEYFFRKKRTVLTLTRFILFDSQKKIVRVDVELPEILTHAILHPTQILMPYFSPGST